jgi:hypothetical protein
LYVFDSFLLLISFQSYRDGVLKFWRDGVFGLSQNIGGSLRIPEHEPVLVIGNDGISSTNGFKGEVTLVGHTVGWDNGKLLAKAYEYTKSRLNHKWTET